MRQRILLAALTAAFVAGGMAVAHAQAAGGGSGAGGGGGGGGAGGSDPSQRGAYTAPRSPIYKDERYNPLIAGHPQGSQW